MTPQAKLVENISHLEKQLPTTGSSFYFDELAVHGFLNNFTMVNIVFTSFPDKAKGCCHKLSGE